MRNAVDIVDEFQRVVADYTGAPYAVAVESCTSALFLSCTYLGVEDVTIPSRTYVSVPNAIIHSGGSVKFRDYEWEGIYQLEPYPVYDAAKRFTSNMYIPGSYMCLSFHGKKILRIGRGGMILTDDKQAADWLTMACWDGRHRGVPLEEDEFETLGWNMYLTPEQAARGLTQMMYMPRDNADMPSEPYSDLSRFKIFQQ